VHVLRKRIKVFVVNENILLVLFQEGEPVSFRGEKQTTRCNPESVRKLTSNKNMVF
jgi:hypothetical protein